MPGRTSFLSTAQRPIAPAPPSRSADVAGPQFGELAPPQPALDIGPDTRPGGALTDSPRHFDGSGLTLPSSNQGARAPDLCGSMRRQALGAAAPRLPAPLPQHRSEERRVGK